MTFLLPPGIKGLNLKKRWNEILLNKLFFFLARNYIMQVFLKLRKKERVLIPLVNTVFYSSTFSSLNFLEIFNIDLVLHNIWLLCPEFFVKFLCWSFHSNTWWYWRYYWKQNYLSWSQKNSSFERSQLLRRFTIWKKPQQRNSDFSLIVLSVIIVKTI